jgi:AraC family transcriptional regulator of adaptative response / DNA-3-methyladenine glycosylase II
MIGGHKKIPHKLIPEKTSTHDLPAAILGGIRAGAVNDKGVRGLADSLHISERHLRRIVRAKTGTSPLHLNDTKRLSTAKRLVTQTTLPIIDIACMSEFSSLRQFNDVFKEAFAFSPSKMRKVIALIAHRPSRTVVSSLTNK